MKCPICDREVTNRQLDFMEHILTEEYISCEDEHHQFSSLYAYGSTEETIGRVSFRTHYSDSKEQLKLVNQQFKAVVELERQAYIVKTQ